MDLGCRVNTWFSSLVPLIESPPHVHMAESLSAQRVERFARRPDLILVLHSGSDGPGAPRGGGEGG